MQFDRVYGDQYPLPLNLEELFKSCCSLVNKDCTQYLVQYCNGRGTRVSAAAVDEVCSKRSTTEVLSEGGTKTKKLGAFQYCTLPATLRPEFKSFIFVEENLFDAVKGHYPREKFEDFLNNVSGKLVKLRAIISSIQWLPDISSTAVWKESRVQCLLQLFIQDFMQSWFGGHTGLDAHAANRNPIELNIEPTNTCWKGYSDLKICTSVSTDINDAAAVIEVKVPFAPSDPRLYHSKALQPKQQVLGQAMGLLQQNQQSPPRQDILCYLTDVMAISVLYYYNNGEKKCAYLSQRVTDAREFCLRLALVCCNFTHGEWIAQVQASGIPTTDVDLSAHEEGRDSGGRTVVLGGTTCDGTAVAAHNSTGDGATVDNVDGSATGKTACGGAQRDMTGYGAHNALVCGFDDFEEEENEDRLNDITNILRWEAKCKGFGFLGTDELKRKRSVEL